jgi:hypothetical protein
MEGQPSQLEDSLRKSGRWSKVAISFASQMAESEARRMLALKTQQALSTAPPSEQPPPPSDTEPPKRPREKERDHALHTRRPAGMLVALSG